MTTITAGSDIDAMCNSCKQELAHVIIAMQSPVLPAQVECKTCRKVHKYRKAKPIKAKSTATKKARNSAKKVEPIVSFDIALCGRTINDALIYSFREPYQEQQLINHKSFGLGIVTEVIDTTKMHVQFRQGNKILAQNIS